VSVCFVWVCCVGWVVCVFLELVFWFVWGGFFWVFFVWFDGVFFVVRGEFFGLLAAVCCLFCRFLWLLGLVSGSLLSFGGCEVVCVVVRVLLVF